MSGENAMFDDSERAVDTVDSTVTDPVDVPSLPEVSEYPSVLHMDRGLPLAVLEEVTSESVV